MGSTARTRASERADEETARLMTVPGIEPVTAIAIQAFAPPDGEASGAVVTSRLGLVLRQHTAGGGPPLHPGPPKARGRVSYRYRRLGFRVRTPRACNVFETACSESANRFATSAMLPLSS